MIKHPSLVRERVVRGVVDMLEHLRIRLSMLPDTELDVLRLLERPQQFDLAEELARFTMEKLGHVTAPENPQYFDKTKRAMSKKHPRRGRGVLKPEDKALLSGAPTEE